MSAHRPLFQRTRLNSQPRPVGGRASTFGRLRCRRTYQDMLTRTHDSSSWCARRNSDAQIPAEVWRRIVTEQKVARALIGRTVRSKGSDLRGDPPAVREFCVSNKS